MNKLFAIPERHTRALNRPPGRYEPEVFGADAEAYHGKMIWLHDLTSIVNNTLSVPQSIMVLAEMLCSWTTAKPISIFSDSTVVVLRPWNPLYGVDTMLHLEKELL